jgi:hypothetical protein
MIQLNVYTTQGCHLCELADAVLSAHPQFETFAISHIEIGDDDALTAKYGWHIPVLQFPNGIELNWPFTTKDIDTALAALN